MGHLYDCCRNAISFNDCMQADAAVKRANDIIASYS